VGRGFAGGGAIQYSYVPAHCGGFNPELFIAGAWKADSRIRVCGRPCDGATGLPIHSAMEVL